MDIRTLQYWHKLEHFYPYVLQEQNSKNIQTYLVSRENNFPSIQHPDIPQGKVLRYYSVYLGIFSVDPALAALEEGICQGMAFRDSGNDTSCFCMFRLKPDGTFMPDSFQISSFPWAIHRVRDGKINMDHWEDDFLQFQKEIFAYLDNHKEPFDYEGFLNLRNLFAEKINWKIAFCSSWMRIDMVSGNTKELLENSSSQPSAQNEDEIENEIEAENDDTDEAIKKNNLLNSFFVRDLERVMDAISADDSQCGKPLQSYLEHKSHNTIDIEKDMEMAFALMSPSNLPLGRWPSDYGARLMQQMDVNAFLSRDARFSQPLFSVNGPPGTGKTTLLKDIIAAIITDRAEQLMSLDMPDDAFVKKPIGRITYNSYDNCIWKLRPNFTQHGILIASSNNGAVENITHGLPALAEIPKKYQNAENRFFAEISDLIFGEGKTWGLNSAALGKRSNCTKFANAWWPLDKNHVGYNFRQVLGATSRNPDMEEWLNAKKQFQKKKEEVRCEFIRIDAIYKKAESLRELRLQIARLNEKLEKEKQSLVNCQKNYDAAASAVQKEKNLLEQLNNQIEEIRNATSLLWLKSIVMPNNPVVIQFKKLCKKRDQLLAYKLPQLRECQESCRTDLDNCRQKIRDSELILSESSRKCGVLEKELEDFRVETHSPFRVDEYFVAGDTTEQNKSSPWGYERLNELREQLFLSALELHRIFVLNSRCMKENLDGYSKVLRGWMCSSQAKAYTAPLLQSFFLMVPVISTTFASVGTFLRHIPAGEIAYLFIDEAGQAVPQAAAGAIWRSRKVIAVGDPLQIEPVVTLHDRVIELLGQYYEQDSILRDKYTSTQTMCDLANRIGGRRSLLEDDDLWVGAPLVVHSRCQQPVFEIANRIAYSNKMIFDSREKEGAVCSWLKVCGSAEEGHYVPAQAEAALPYVIEAFRQYAQEKNEEHRYPSLFVITPFRSVRAGVARYIKRTLPNALSQRGIRVEKKCIRDWSNDCIGTIHTFQGKEANTVILCLGVDSGGKGTGAVDWAGERPNILNVAVTRSKHKLYIIGDPNIWCRKSYFKAAREVCDSFSNAQFR